MIFSFDKVKILRGSSFKFSVNNRMKILAEDLLSNIGNKTFSVSLDKKDMQQVFFCLNMAY